MSEKIIVTNAEEFSSAIAKVGADIELGADLTLDAVVVNQDCSINLNGFKIEAVNKTAFRVEGNGVEVNLNGEKPGSKVFGTIIVGWRNGDGCSLFIKGGEYVAKESDQPAVQTNGTCQNITLMCEDASFSSTDDTFYLAAGGVTTLKSCKVEGATGLYVKGSKITLTDTSISADGEAADPVPNGNGASSTGDGIIIDAKQGYTGNVELVVDDACVISSLNRNALCETYTDAQATVARKVVLAGLLIGPVTASDYFKQAVASGNATVDFTEASFYGEVSPNFLPEGISMFKQVDGSYRALDAKQGQTLTYFGTDEEVAALKASVDKVAIQPVSASDKVAEVQKILRDLNTTEMMKGDRSVGKMAIMKIVDILSKVTAEDTTMGTLANLKTKALEVYFLLYRAIESAGSMK